MSVSKEVVLNFDVNHLTNVLICYAKKGMMAEKEMPFSFLDQLIDQIYLRR